MRSYRRFAMHVNDVRNYYCNTAGIRRNTTKVRCYANTEQGIIV